MSRPGGARTWGRGPDTSKKRRKPRRRVSETPEDLRYTDSHEWIRVEGDEAVIGITDHAQRALNDIVFVELPAPGDHFDAGDDFGVVESVKSVSDLYLPMAGTVVAINEALDGSPELVNEAPYGDGWLIRVRMDDPDSTANLLDAAAYAALL